MGRAPAGVARFEEGLRRAELLAATCWDRLGLGQPMETCFDRTDRHTHAERWASRATAGDRLLRQSGRLDRCHADSHELSVLFGDDIAFRADTYAVDMAGLTVPTQGS